MRSDFAAFILSHGRPRNVTTYKTLRRQGYTGRIVIVIDNTDEQGDAYREEFAGVDGVEVFCFDKAAVADFDIADNRGGRKCVVFARNASWEIAQELGLRYFLQLDDDYSDFNWRFTDKFEWATAKHFQDPDGPRFGTVSLDRVFDAFLEFLSSTPTKTIAMAQGGDFIGGPKGAFGQVLKLRRKVMNSFFCDAQMPVGFVGRINEDTTTYTWRATTGDLFFTYNAIALNQVQTQQNAGGLTTVYLEDGTYIKSMYTVLFHPSGAKVAALNSRSNPRLHHSINWNATAPKILRETLRKPRP